MILLGKADKPLYLLLRDEKLEFKDAAPLWGKDCFETDQILKKEWGEKAQISCIGPAAEKLVRFCGVFTDGTDARTAGRCGLGTLMGSKKVKAVVVQGTGEVPVLDAESLRGRMKELVSILDRQDEGDERLRNAGDCGSLRVSWRPPGEELGPGKVHGASPETQRAADEGKVSEEAVLLRQLSGGLRAGRRRKH